MSPTGEIYNYGFLIKLNSLTIESKKIGVLHFTTEFEKIIVESATAVKTVKVHRPICKWLV